MSQYNVGDTVWYLDCGYRIFIKCKIVDIDEPITVEPNKENFETSFYWLDEPIGHAVTDDELLSYVDHKTPISLEEFRQKRISFIESTWRRCGIADKILMSEYPDKQRNVDYFSF